MDLPHHDNRFQHAHISLLLRSYRRWLGKDLLEGVDTDSIAQQVYEASFVVVSHDTAPDPIFNYANLAALQLFEMSWKDFTALPSRLSAEPVNQQERARLLESVTQKNYIDDYSGMRISATGKRFRIPAAVVWNIVDDEGQYWGQAATFSDWQHIDTG